MITYQQEKVSEIWDELMPLLFAHWTEIAHYQDISLDPDVEAYAKVEEMGALRCYTARADGLLVGYVVFFVRHNLHYRVSFQAVQDVLFLSPEYRHGGAGVKLIRYSERQLAEDGVQAVYHHAKRTNQVGKLLLRLGYEHIDEIYGKRLDTGE